MPSQTVGSIDLDKPGKYPVVLSDALLGKASNEVFTGIRYNHKPDPSSSSSNLHLQPSDDPTTYDLSLKDNSDKYQYVGSRSTGESQFVLIFDPEKKHFVLHRVDSSFDMNLVSTPWTQDSKELQSQYPQLEPKSQSQARNTQSRKAVRPKPPTAAIKSAPKRPKIEKPKEKPKKKPARAPSPEPDEDSDDDLLIEYPDGPSNYQSTPVFQGNISETSDEDEDVEGEEFEEVNQDVDHLKLPSPANNNAGGLSDEDLEMDLEAELEKALEGGESDESEEE